ncbi:hypothetical protein [Streptomyces sp. NPDC004324]
MTDGPSRAQAVTVVGGIPVGEKVAARTGAAHLHTVAMEREPPRGDGPFRAREPGRAPQPPVVARTDARRATGLGAGRSREHWTSTRPSHTATEWPRTGATG